MSISLDSMRITVSNVAKSKIKSGLEKACLIVETDAKNNCPKDQGILANSITHEVIDDTGYIYSPLSYAVYVELGTGIFAQDGTGRQTPWRYFYTGKKLSSEEQEYISKNGWQVFQGKTGIWRTTRGMKGVHYFYNALNDNKDKIKGCF